jgi:putative membrane protein
MNGSKHHGRTGFAALLCALASMAANADRQANDQNFVAQAVQAGMAEVELSKIAMTKSTNEDVRTLAGLMVREHSQANEELTGLVKGHDIDVPSTLDAKHQETVTELTAKSGADFDAAYVKQMVEDHAEAVPFFRAAASANDLSPALANFAYRTVPVLEEHKQMADELQTKFEHAD